MLNVTNHSHNTMGQINSNNLRTQTTYTSEIFNMISSFMLLIVAVFIGITTSVMPDDTDKKPVLPFTRFDTCSSTSVSVSPTYGNTIRRVSSSDAFITTV
jgi:hypothetical protein